MSFESAHVKKLVVADTEELWRGISKQWLKKEENGRIRPSSGAFKTRNRELSVDVASKTNPETSIRNFVALVGLSASIPINHGNRVVYDPLPENPAHALILGKISKSCIKEIIAQYHWVILPRNE